MILNRTTKFGAMAFILGACLAFTQSGLPMNTAAQTNAARPDQFARIRTQIKAKLVEEQIPSVAVAVGRNGKVLWEEAFGWADRENRISATEHTMYSIGSVSKPVTATGLMVLVQRGLVELDQPVNKYLGEVQLQSHVGDVNQATVRRVANHTSGLARHSTIFYSDELYQPPPNRRINPPLRSFAPRAGRNV